VKVPLELEDTQQLQDKTSMDEDNNDSIGQAASGGGGSESKSSLGKGISTKRLNNKSITSTPRINKQGSVKQHMSRTNTAHQGSQVKFAAGKKNNGGWLDSNEGDVEVPKKMATSRRSSRSGDGSSTEASTLTMTTGIGSGQSGSGGIMKSLGEKAQQLGLWATNKR